MSLPIASNGALKLPFSELEIGSQTWFEWLSTAKSFRVETNKGSYTATKRERKGIHYWYAARKERGVVKNVYLGAAQELDWEGLETGVVKLNEAFGGVQPEVIQFVTDPTHVQPSQLYNQKELEILITEMKQLREENQLLKEKLGAIALRIETLPSDRDLVRSRDSGAVRRALEPLRQLIAEYDSVQNQLQR